MGHARLGYDVMEDTPSPQEGRNPSRSRDPRAAFSAPDQPPAKRGSRRAAPPAVTFQPPSVTGSAETSKPPRGTGTESTNAAAGLEPSEGMPTSRSRPAAKARPAKAAHHPRKAEPATAADNDTPATTAKKATEPAKAIKKAPPAKPTRKAAPAKAAKKAPPTKTEAPEAELAPALETIDAAPAQAAADAIQPPKAAPRKRAPRKAAPGTTAAQAVTAPAPSAELAPAHQERATTQAGAEPAPAHHDPATTEAPTEPAPAQPEQAAEPPRAPTPAAAADGPPTPPQPAPPHHEPATLQVPAPAAGPAAAHEEQPAEQLAPTEPVTATAGGRMMPGPTDLAEVAPTDPAPGKGAEPNLRHRYTEAWAKLVADPGHAPELLALAAVQTVGPRASEWARRIRESYPGATDAGLARLAAAQFTRFGSVGSLFAAVAGSYASIALLGAAALTQAELILHLAAAYGLDPADEERAVDLLVLTRVHPDRATAEAAIARAKQPAYEEGGLTAAAGRLGRVIVTRTGGWTGVRLASRFFPGASLVAATLTMHAATETVAHRANAYYRRARQSSGTKE